MTVTAPRPRYHLTPPDHWLSDPNGLVWHDGYWHAYYQHNPHGEEWGHMSWGHARSRDLVEWQHSPVAIADNSAWFIFSGCALVDPDNRAGFGPGAVIAAYTAAAIDGSRQWQNLAISRDGGTSFVDDDRNPLLDLGLKDFRDPNILWHQPSSQWIMVVAFSAEHRAALYGSTDLRQWRHLSDVGPWDVQGEVWECPMLIELPIEGSDDTRWLFKVDALHGAAGSGSLALGGLFDGRSFHPDGGWQMVDGGRDFYAAVPWHEPRDADGRPCWIGWTGNHGYQSTLPRRSWRGAMSSPRRLSWRRGGNGFKLIQQVEPALAAAFVPQPVIDGRDGSAEIALASRLSLEALPGTRWSLRIAAGDRSLKIDFDGGTLRIDRAAGFNPAFDAPIIAAVAPGPITLWLDGGIIEIEADDGAQWISLQHQLFAERASLTLDADPAMAFAIAAFDPLDHDRFKVKPLEA